MLKDHVEREHPGFTYPVAEGLIPPHVHVWSADPSWGEHGPHGGNLRHPTADMSVRFLDDSLTALLA
jgi:hypothetical protein